MILPQQSPSVAGRLRVFGSRLNTTKCPQARYLPCGALAMSLRGYWHDGSSRRRSGYMRQFKKWADEDFEEYKKREAAFNEHFRNRMEESWPEIKPWLSWALPKEFYNEAFSKTHEHLNQSTHTQDKIRPRCMTETSNRNECSQQSSPLEPSTARANDADRDNPTTSEPSFEYDPITMRRVPRRQPRSYPRTTRSDTTSEPISIPVKRFVHPKQSPAREGQVHVTNRPKSSAQKSQQDIKESTPPPSPVRQKSKIENALDRHLRNVAKSDGPKVTQETTRDDGAVEDLDNLRANNIRSSPAYQKVIVNGLAKPRKERLNQQYEDHLQHMDAVSAGLGDLNTKHSLSRKVNIAMANDGRSESPKFDHISPTTMFRQSQINPAVSQKEKDLEYAKKRKEQAIREVHTAEISAQKAFMESAESRSRKNSEASSSSSVSKVTPAEGDMATNVHEFADRGRWYKQRAPSFDSVQQAERRRRDKDLIKEVRGIYEDSYGTIDTRHRHVSSRESEGTRASRNIEGASSGTIDNNREVGRLLQNINTQLIRSVIDMRRLILGAYGKQPVAAKAFVGTEESVPRSTKSVSPTRGPSSSSKSPARSSSTDGRQIIPDGHTTYKILSLQGDRVNTIKIIGPIEDPEVRSARIPDIVDHFKNKDQDIEPLFKEVERLHAKGYELCNDKSQGNSRIVMRKSLPKIHHPVQQGFYKILTWDSSKEQMTLTITRGSNGHAHRKDIPVPVALHNVRSPELFAPFVAAFQKDGYIMTGKANDLNRCNETNMVCFWKEGPLAEGLKEGTQVVDPQDYILKDGHSSPPPPFSAPAATPTNESSEGKPTPKNFWPNPVDGTLSPTGFVNYESLRSDEPPESDGLAPSSSTTSSLSTHGSTHSNNTSTTGATSESSSTTNATLSPRNIHSEEPISSGTILRPPSPFPSSSPTSHLHNSNPFSSRRATTRLIRRAITMQERRHLKGRGGRLRKLLKRMVWCGVGLVASFYLVGLVVRGLWWVGGVF